MLSHKAQPTPVSGQGLLAVEVTARCNRRCLYCYNTWPRQTDDPPADLPASELVAVVEEALRATGRRAIQITGGEPLLRPDLFELIEALEQPDRTISLVTDAGLVDDHATRELVRLGIRPVQPTLLAAQRDLHDRLKGAESFDATVDGIARLLRAGVPVSVSFVCLRSNYEHFREVVELCFALGVRSVAFSRFCAAGSGAARHADLSPSPAMVAACLDVAEEATARLGIKVHVAISVPRCLPEPDRHPHLAFGHCALGSSTPPYTIDPWGRLRACSVSPEILGDLRVESWGTVVGRAKEAYFREVATVPADCRGCSHETSCRGGCRESARGTGSLDRPDPLCQ